MIMTKKIKMNDNKNRFENGTLKGRMKELLSISFFTLVAVFLSIFLADIIIFPLTYYSIRNVDIFNILFKYTGIAVISFVLIFLLFNKVKTLYRDGNSFKSILIYVFLRPFQYTGFFLFTLILIAAIILVIYFIFSSNYYHLHRIAGGA